MCDLEFKITMIESCAKSKELNEYVSKALRDQGVQDPEAKYKQFKAKLQTDLKNQDRQLNQNQESGNDKVDSYVLALFDKSEL